VPDVDSKTWGNAPESRASRTRNLALGLQEVRLVTTTPPVPLRLMKYPNTSHP
jgi:hypothetical protein